MRRATLGLMLLAQFALAGCGVMQPPRAWEKGVLARPEMTMAGDTLEQRHLQHTYQSKENGTGTASVGGGGCGCN